MSTRDEDKTDMSNTQRVLFSSFSFRIISSSKLFVHGITCQAQGPESAGSRYGFKILLRVLAKALQSLKLVYSYSILSKLVITL